MGWTVEYVVDLWRTSGTHKVNIGIKKQQEYMSKSRQFTKDTEIIGEVKKGDEIIGYITYREGKWKSEKMNSTLVLKFFSESFNWKATLEELKGRELANSFAANKSLPYFSYNGKNTKVLFSLEKVIRQNSFGKQVYSILVVDDETELVHIYRAEADRISLGTDWTIYNHEEKKIGVIDGSGFNIGGKYTIKLDQENFEIPDELIDCLICFAGANKFLEEIEERIEKELDLLKKGEEDLIIDKNEMALYKNPRMIRI